MQRTLVLTLFAVSLSGCGVAAKIDARSHYQDSLADYRACLDANGNNPQACEGTGPDNEGIETLANGQFVAAAAS